MEDFDEASNEITWKTGTIIYKFGDQPDYAFFLKEGEVESISKNGTTVGFINKDEVFGEISILLNTNRSVTAKTTKDSIAIKIPRTSLIKQLNNAPTLIKAILRSNLVRLTNLDNTIKKNLFSDDNFN